MFYRFGKNRQEIVFINIDLKYRYWNYKKIVKRFDKIQICRSINNTI